jgi:hypothetical protein
VGIDHTTLSCNHAAGAVHGSAGKPANLTVEALYYLEDHFTLDGHYADDEVVGIAGLYLAITLLVLFMAALANLPI